EVELDPRCELVRALDRDAGRNERPRHDPLRVGHPPRLAERQRLAVALPAHALTASGRSASSASSSPSPTTSFAASPARRPRATASSATTSIAAALTSTR